MRRWWRSGRTSRLARIEARLTDLEDAEFSGGAAGLGDELAAVDARLGELAAEAVTSDELLETRLEVARLAGEVGRLAAQVRALHDRRDVDLSDLGDEPDWAASA